jgi:hypothetical protein
MSAPRRDSATHLIGLLLGTEKDWPTAFETLTRRLDPISYRGVPHHVDTERMTIEPFDLRAPVRHDVVIDRLAWWYYHPREWLKKAALVNGHLPDQQPLHVPGDGEALRVLRDDPARLRHPGHRAGALQESR